MKILRRGTASLFLVVFVAAALSMAQDSTLKLAGSSAVIPLVETVAASAENVAVESAVTGTSDGFARFCATEVDAVAASRAMTAAEEAACSTNGVDFVEVLLGHNILALVGHPADAFYGSCLAASTLNTIFQPSASRSVVNWTSVSAEYTDTPLSVYVPVANTLDYALADNFINGAGLRADAVALPAADILEAVSSTPGAIGLVSYQAFVTSPVPVNVLSVDFQTGENGCVSPSVENFEGGFYTLGERFFLYLNAQITADQQALLNALADPATSSVIIAQGYTAPTPFTYERNLAVASGEAAGRVFTREQETFTIPETLAGQVNLGGSPALINWIRPTTESLTAVYADLQFDASFDGIPAGLRRFCNGELDAVVTQGPLESEDATNCEANSITTYDIALGRKVVLMVANAGDDFAACLTQGQVRAVWGIGTEAVETWQDIDPSFPQIPLKAFAPAASSEEGDLLLRTDEGVVLPMRPQVEIFSDALYRAAAVANVEGSIALLTWDDYQSAIANGQQGIQPVAVDAGSGCAAPEDATSASGDYPYILSSMLVVNQSSLNDINVQSFLWTLFEDTRETTLNDLGYIGREASFADIRSDLLRGFAAAAAAAAASPEATPEAGLEATESAPTPETTPAAEATSAPETTPEAEATAEATPAS
jgi:phosphate transport system substrate-binding protein